MLAAHICQHSEDPHQTLFHLTPSGQSLCWSAVPHLLRKASDECLHLQICTEYEQHCNANPGGVLCGHESEQGSPITMMLAASEVHHRCAEATTSITP